MEAPKRDLKAYLERLISGPGVALSCDEFEEVGGWVASGSVDAHQLAGFLVALAVRGESWEAVVGFARAMRAAAHGVRLGCGGRVQEIVGTGGDGQNTVNISTAAAVLAAACGVPVCKHGSVSVSSRSGSADVLAQLGVAHLGPAAIAPCMEQCGIAFMFAPLFHPAMAHVLPVRKALRVRTVFNILGPLLNPAGARHLLLGVYSPALLPLYARAVAALGVERALIVHTPLPCGGGLDELATVAPAAAIEVCQGGEVLRELTIDSAAWGVPQGTLADLRGGDPAENAAAISALLQGGPGVDSHLGRTVALNAGAALYCFGAAQSIQEGYETALGVLRGGKAGTLLGKWALTTQQLASEARG